MHDFATFFPTAYGVVPGGFSGDDGGWLDFTYEEHGRLAEVRDRGRLLESCAYDSFGRRTRRKIRRPVLTGDLRPPHRGPFAVGEGPWGTEIDIYLKYYQKLDDCDAPDMPYKLFLLNEDILTYDRWGVTGIQGWNDPAPKLQFSYDEQGRPAFAQLACGTVISYLHTSPGLWPNQRWRDDSLSAVYHWDSSGTLAACNDFEQGLTFFYEYGPNGITGLRAIENRRERPSPGALPDAPRQFTIPPEEGRILSLRCETDVTGMPKVWISNTTGREVKRVLTDSLGLLQADSRPDFFPHIGFGGGLEDWDTGLVRFGRHLYEPQHGGFLTRPADGEAPGWSAAYGGAASANSLPPGRLDTAYGGPRDLAPPPVRHGNWKNFPVDQASLKANGGWAAAQLRNPKSHIKMELDPRRFTNIVPILGRLLDEHWKEHAASRPDGPGLASDRLFNEADVKRDPLGRFAEQGGTGTLLASAEGRKRETYDHREYEVMRQKAEREAAERQKARQQEARERAAKLRETRERDAREQQEAYERAIKEKAEEKRREREDYFRQAGEELNKSLDEQMREKANKQQVEELQRQFAANAPFGMSGSTPEKKVLTQAELEAGGNSLAYQLMREQSRLIVERADIGSALARGEATFEDIRKIVDKENELIGTLARSDAAIKIFSGIIVDLDRYGQVDLIGDLFGLAMGTGATIAAIPGVAAAAAAGGPAGAAAGISGAATTVMTAFSLASTLPKIMPTFHYEYGRMAFDLGKRQMESLTPEQRKTMQPDYVAIDRIATTYAAFNMAFDTGTALFWTKYSDVILEKIGVATIKSQFRAFLLHSGKNVIAMEAGKELEKALVGKTVGEAITVLKNFATSKVASDLKEDFDNHLKQQKK